MPFSGHQEASFVIVGCTDSATWHAWPDNAVKQSLWAPRSIPQLLHLLLQYGICLTGGVFFSHWSDQAPPEDKDPLDVDECIA